MNFVLFFTSPLPPICASRGSRLLLTGEWDRWGGSDSIAPDLLSRVQPRLIPGIGQSSARRKLHPHSESHTTLRIPNPPNNGSRELSIREMMAEDRTWMLRASV